MDSSRPHQRLSHISAHAHTRGGLRNTAEHLGKNVPCVTQVRMSLVPGVALIPTPCIGLPACRPGSVPWSPRARGAPYRAFTQNWPGATGEYSAGWFAGSSLNGEDTVTPQEVKPPALGRQATWGPLSGWLVLQGPQLKWPFLAKTPYH